jgi:hypothetical protein
MTGKDIAGWLVGSFVGYEAMAFMAWACHPGNTAKSVASGRLASAIWTVLSFPMFVLAPTSADRFFWPMLMANGVLWAAAVLGVIFMARRRRE